MPESATAVEKFYSVGQVAERLQLSTTSVRKLFRGRPGVIDVATRQPGKHWYTKLRISESALQEFVKEKAAR
jgi:hypothetical protein